MRNYRPLLAGGAAAVVLWVIGGYAICARAAEDVFYDVPLSDLKITAGEFPSKSTMEKVDFDWRSEMLSPLPALDGAGDVYLDMPDQFFWGLHALADDLSKAHLLIRATQGKDVPGRVGLPNVAGTNLSPVKFSVPASGAKESAREAFYLAKLHYYERLLQHSAPGAAWFRYQLMDAEQNLHKLDEKKYPADRPISQNWQSTDRGDAYDLFSGGHAISENLQLDRAMRPTTTAGQASVDIDSLTGITIARIDWTALLRGADPKLDPLAKFIPADQHVLFFPSFADVIRLSDESNQSGPLMMKLAALGKDSADTMERYQRQLGLPLSELGRMVGKAAIKSVAVTGSDPYFPTGTDFAVILETDHPDVLAGLLSAQIALSAAKHPGAVPQSGEAGGWKYQGFRAGSNAVLLPRTTGWRGGDHELEDAIGKVGRGEKAKRFDCFAG